MPTEQTDTTQTPPEEITYTPTVWADGEDGGTPINADNMNNIEEAIVALVERTTKKVVTSMIADGAVTNAKLDQTLRDSLSRFTEVKIIRDGFGSIVIDAEDRRIVFSEVNKNIGFQKKKQDGSFEVIFVK